MGAWREMVVVTGATRVQLRTCDILGIQESHDDGLKSELMYDNSTHDIFSSYSDNTNSGGNVIFMRTHDFTSILKQHPALTARDNRQRIPFLSH